MRRTRLLMNSALAEAAIERMVGLENSADVIIWERIKAGDLQSYGHGWVIEDDLFSVAGRASWLLKEVSGEDFGAVKLGVQGSDREALARKWSQWLALYDCQAAGA